MALVIILLFCLTAATFVSHTVASLILMPVIATLGISIGMPEIAVMGSAFAGTRSVSFPILSLFLFRRWGCNSLYSPLHRVSQCLLRWRCPSPLSLM